MSNSALTNFKLNFPYLYKEAVSYEDLNGYDIIITLKNGASIVYDDVDKSFRNLPKDSNSMTEDECRREFGIRLEKIMNRKRITQEELSYKTGISQGMISNYITGRNSPSFYNVDKIAKALGCSVDEFRYI